MFVSNAVRWLAGRENGGANAVPAGQTYVPAEGMQIGASPRRDGDVLAEKNLSLTGEPLRLRKNGFYELRGAEDVRLPWLAVNTANAEESDLRGAKSNRTVLAWSLAWGGLHPWQWLALAALLLIWLEWYLHHRRITE